MEELNNHQMVYLTMFVSFVVSIATGIITVAMLEEAPPTLTQTVNRVVEHTIERVVTGTSSPTTIKEPVVTNITKEVTVYAKEDDLIVSAVEKNQSRMVKIYVAGVATSTHPRSIGFVVSRDGMVVTETADLLGAAESLANEYTLIIDGKQYAAAVVKERSPLTRPVTFLRVQNLSASSTLDAVAFGRNENPKLGQSLIVMGGLDADEAFKTSVARVRPTEKMASSTPDSVGGNLEVTPAIPAGNSGALVTNLDGQAVGIVLSDPDNASGYVVCPVTCILAYIKSISLNQ